MSIDITPFYEPDSGTWTYLVADRATGKAAVIDPVWVYDPVSGFADTGAVEDVLSAAADRGLEIEWVLETHAHADHLTAAAAVREKTGARIGIGRGIRHVQRNFARIFDLPDLPTDGSQFDRLFEEGDTLALGETRFRIMEVPGHTDDSIAYVTEGAAFVGDTLFAPAFGTARCDFPGGDAGRLYDSIARLHALPDDTRLYLCHDYPAEGAEPRSHVTVAASRRDNVHVGGDADRAAFVAMREARDATLDLPRLILPSLQVNIRAGAPPEPGRNGAAYLKIPFNASIEALLAGPPGNEEGAES
jgi:glyoxylase-like metal-dependent hydrolase (beta-lactamase superfamily II)